MDKKIDSDNINEFRHEQHEKLAKLTDFKKAYSVDLLLHDLMAYFDNEIDFDLEKIKKILSKPGKFQQLVDTACKLNTHPVAELIKEIFKTSTCGDD